MSDIAKKFIARTRAAVAARATEIRLPIEDAHELNAYLAELLLELHVKSKENRITISYDGGRLETK